MIKQSGFLFLAFFTCQYSFAQPDRWQQKVNYEMAVNMNVETNQYTGTQKLTYWNNSPDTLKRVFFHLYFNAFQPNSMMDARSRHQGTISLGSDRNGNPRLDWDGRVKDRIEHLTPEQQGFLHVSSISMDGRKQNLKELETILEVDLDKPILPHSKVLFDLEFKGQVPLQVRRSGRDNPATEVRYSMSQWYPKLCEYDYEGWHPTPYVGREFYGVWGDYDVKITIDKTYILGGTGYLQNADQIGYGYEKPGTKVNRPAGNTLTWHFKAPNVHDFMWAADPKYIHKTRVVRDGLVLHLLYKPTTATAKEWEAILDNAEKALPYMDKTFGFYPYKQYSFVHGGDGGMEYPMATLLYDPGAWLHEWMHSWYQMMLGTNESEYAWMDEGFTTYASSRVQGFLSGDTTGFAQAGSYRSYVMLAKSGMEEPLTTHADHFNTNFAYSIASYSKGAVFMEQLGYIIGAQQRDRLLLEYYNQWRFKHPNADDLIRLAEKVSNIELDWYKEYWVEGTKTIDYKIDSLWQEGSVTKVRMRKLGDVPMPIDLQLTFKDGAKELHYVPLYSMFGEKPAENDQPRKVYAPWKWTDETYIVETEHKITDISEVEIDPSQRMADIDRKNNKLELKW